MIAEGASRPLSGADGGVSVESEVAVGRWPGGQAKNLPLCPRPGHADRKVVLDGTYGKPTRQRLRCVGKVVNGATGEVRGFHRFTPELPRLRIDGERCDSCDSVVPAHAGPVSSRRCGFAVREVAAALVAVGSGSSYAVAADRAQADQRLRRSPQRRILTAEASSARRSFFGEGTHCEWLEPWTFPRTYIQPAAEADVARLRRRACFCSSHRRSGLCGLPGGTTP